MVGVADAKSYWSSGRLTDAASLRHHVVINHQRLSNSERIATMAPSTTQQVHWRVTASLRPQKHVFAEAKGVLRVVDNEMPGLSSSRITGKTNFGATHR